MKREGKSRRKPQTMTKRGKSNVAVVDAAEYERLRQLEHQYAVSFAEHLLAMPTDDGEFDRLEGRMRETGF